MNGHVCLSLELKPRWKRGGGEARGGPPNPGTPKYQATNPESKQKAFEETEAQRGAEACLRSHSQLEVPLGVERRGESGPLVQCSLHGFHPVAFGVYAMPSWSGEGPGAGEPSAG